VREREEEREERGRKREEEREKEREEVICGLFFPGKESLMHSFQDRATKKRIKSSET